MLNSWVVEVGGGRGSWVREVDVVHDTLGGFMSYFSLSLDDDSAILSAISRMATGQKTERP